MLIIHLNENFVLFDFLIFVYLNGVNLYEKSIKKKFIENSVQVFDDDKKITGFFRLEFVQE